MKKLMCSTLVIAGLGACLIARAEEAVGNWVGRMASGFKVKLEIVKSADGYTASLTNPGGQVTAIDQVRADGSRLHFGVTKLGLSYDGAWDEQQKAWGGTLNFQGAYALNFRRATAADLNAPVPKRPQEDAIRAAARPYTEHEVAFDNRSAAVRLAGTLSLPQGKGPFPAVVLVSGTGRNTRDQEVDGHLCFLVLADALSRQGIAVLRYDKRGVGGSSGLYRDATTADFASDADAAANFLKQDTRVDPRRIGLVGHSEGGVIAPFVAAANKDVAFVVMIAGPGIRGDQLFALQSAMTAQAYGVPADIIARRKLFDQQLYEAINAAPSVEAARERAKALVAQGVADKIIDANDAAALPMTLTSPWQRYFLAYDPASALREVTVPVLALNGTLDVQVPAAESLAAIRTALRGNKDATVLELPGMNHLLQSAATGSPAEYGTIDETMAPSALKTITDWVSVRSRAWVPFATPNAKAQPRP